MAEFSLYKDSLEKLIEISFKAGKAIMEIYNTDFDFEKKIDQSPLTAADLRSHEIISYSLSKLSPKIPILSEESSHITYSERSGWNEYWLIDPLDGTKEFISRNGEFTTNIALIKNNRPVFGIIHAPLLNETYWGLKNIGSYALYGNEAPKKIEVSDAVKVPLRVMTSRSHKSGLEEAYLDRIGNYSSISMGSSLKLCYLASGKADIYPRFGETSEWDIAAGDAILTFAGGKIIDKGRSELSYNKQSLLNGSFFASGNSDLQENIVEHFFDILI